MRGACLLLLLAACQAAPVEVRAAPADEGGVAVWFARASGGPKEHVPIVEASGGRIADTIAAPNRRSVAVIWVDPAGRLDCSFPYNSGDASYLAGSPTDARRIRYVFLERRGVRITGSVARACPIVSRLRLEVRLDASLLPARILSPRSVKTVVEMEAVVSVELPRDKQGGLVAGDLALLLQPAKGASIPFVISVDRDGVVAAVSGYLETGAGG